jgi:Ca-activated chloride channel homolog
MNRHGIGFGLKILLTCCFFIFFISRFSIAASFMGEVTEVKNGKTRMYKIFFQDTQYRMDMKEGGKTFTVLVNRETGKTQVLDASRKQFRELDNDSINSLSQNPFESHLFMTKTYTVKEAGVEPMNGLICNKQVIEVSGKDAVTAWVYPKFNFPIKIVNHINDYSAEIKGLRQVPAIRPDFFSVPQGYSRFEEPKPEPAPTKHEEKAALTTRADFQAPIGRRVGAGGELVIQMNPKRVSKLVLSNEGKTEASVMINTYRDTIPVSVSAVKEKIIRLKKGVGRKEFEFREKQNPDSVAVKVTKGVVYVRCEQQSPMGKKEKYQENFLKDKADLGFLTRPGQQIFCKITGNSQDDPQSMLMIKFFKDQYKTAVLEEVVVLQNGESKTWEFPPEKGIVSGEIHMEEGGVQFALSQSAVNKIEQTGPDATSGAEQKRQPAAQMQETKQPGKSKQPTVGAGQAPEAASMILVLDASGSMWGQLNGKAKITIAKEVISELIDAIPKDFQTGLIVYGHRRKGDCNDIEMVLAPGPHNPAAMKQKIQAISPKGKTPLSEAVKQAAEALKYTEEKATVVLVSDGLETCNVDPCKLATELAMTGVDFTVHVIGFDISKGDQERLRCLADKTGGLFLSADNATSLRDALFKTVEKIKEAPAPVVEDPGTATLSAPDTVPAGAPFKVQWEGPGSKGDYIAIATEDTEDLRYKEYRYTQSGNPVELKAPGKTGTYELRYIHKHSHKVIGRARIEVTPVQAALETPPSVNAASQFEVTWQGPDYAGDYISIALPDEAASRYLFYAYTRDGSPLKLRAPADPGTYEIRYIMEQDSTLLAKNTITIKATAATVQAPESAPVATEFEVTWTGPDNKGDYISIARPDQASRHYINYTYTDKGSPLKVRAPSDPGVYEIRYVQYLGDKTLATATIEITPVTAMVQAPEKAAAGSLFEVTWTGPDNNSDYISVARPDQAPRHYINYTYTADKGSPLKVQAPPDPGAYKVRYILGRGDKLLAETNIEITSVTASLRPPKSAAAGSKFEVSWEGPGYKDDYVSIARPDQRDTRYLHYSYTGNGNPLKIQAPSEPGTYEVRYIQGKGKKLLAKTAIRIDPLTALLQAPGSATAGSTIEVSWVGPGYDNDYISIALPDQRAKSYKTYTYSSNGNPLKVKVPKEAGNYEIRYIMGLNNTLLARKALTVTP